MLFTNIGLYLHYKINNKMNKKQTEIQIFQIYNNLSVSEKREFRQAVCEVCMIEPPTWYSWQIRKSIPKWHLQRVAGLSEEYSPKTQAI